METLSTAEIEGRTMNRRPTRTRRPWRVGPAGAVLLAGAFVGLTACGNLLDVENEQDVLETDLNQESALAPVVNGVAGDFNVMYADAILQVGLTSFELIHTGSYPSWALVETGVMDRISTGNGLYDEIERAIWVANDAIRRIDETFPDAGSMVEAAQVRIWAGYAEITLADEFCEGTFDGGPAQPPSDFYQMAEGHFTEAMAIAQAANEPDWVMRARAGRARARLMLGDYAGTLTDAKGIPEGFEFEAIYSLNSGREQNSVASLTRTLTRREAGVHPYFYQDDRYVADPRVDFIDRGPLETGPDPTRQYVEQEKYKLESDPIPISSWQEARLMEAEAELNVGTVARAVELIDEVRAYRNLDPYTGDMTKDAVMEQVLYERSAELWLQGHRLNDLRRTNSPLLAGRDVCFQIGLNEWESNPNLGG